MAWTQQQAAKYLADNPDVAAAINAGTMDSAYGHFSRHGSGEGRAAPTVSAPAPTPAPTSTATTSATARPSPAGGQYNPHHYIDFKQTNPNAPTDFNETYYLKKYKDVADSGMDAWDHYQQFGKSEGRVFNQLHDKIQNGSLGFDADGYLASNQDVADAGVDPYLHFAQYGYKEGRAPTSNSPIYANMTQTQQQAAAGFDPIAAKLIAMGQTPSWGTSGFGHGTAEGHGAQPKSADEIKDEIDKIISGPAGGAFNDNVQSNIAQVIAADSELMKLAGSRARQVANSRGLMNSSMAENAAQDAVLNVAIPIGSQQASQNFQANENARGFGYQSSLLGQELDWRGEQAGLDRQHQLTQQDREIGFRSAEASLDRELQERLQTWNLNATEADNAARQVYAAQSLLQNTLVNINANTNLSADQRSTQIAQAQADFDLAMYLVEQIYRIDLDWAA